MTPEQQPPRPPRGSGGIVALLVFMGLGVVVMGVSAVGWVASRLVNRSRADVALPAVSRQVPHHPSSVLDGCSRDDQTALVNSIHDAILVGAPLYNSGNFAGCYHLYEGTAEDLERKLPAACAGPVRALEAGRQRAVSSTDPGSQAWAMRDAFDGLLDVVARRGAR